LCLQIKDWGKLVFFTCLEWVIGIHLYANSNHFEDSFWCDLELQGIFPGGFLGSAAYYALMLCLLKCAGLFSLQVKDWGSCIFYLHEWFNGTHLYANSVYIFWKS